MTICPVCEGDKTRHLLAWRGDWEIYTCDACDLTFTTPLPTEAELQDYYQGFLYRKPSAKKVKEAVAHAKEELIQLFKLDETGVSGKRFLDYGGGTGIKAQAARELGFDVCFYDVDEQANRFVQETFGLHVIEHLSTLKTQRFDHILADNVIEHTRHPVAFVKQLYDLLKPGGTLIIKTPNGRNTELLFYPAISLRSYFSEALRYNSPLQAIRAYGHRFWSCDPPRHLYAFSEQNLTATAHASGIRHVDIDYYHIPLFEYSLAKLLFTKPSRPQGYVLRLLAVFAIPFEMGLKALQAALKAARLISPGGILLRLSK